MRRGAALGALLVLLALAAGDLGAQCAMCRSSLTSSAEGRGLIPEFNRAILLMIAAPYVVFATVGLAAFRGRIREAWKRRTTRRPPAAR
jgi:hypothetical protein